MNVTDTRNKYGLDVDVPNISEQAVRMALF
jgi:hypothetical protein